MRLVGIPAIAIRERIIRIKINSMGVIRDGLLVALQIVVDNATIDVGIGNLRI